VENNTGIMDAARASAPVSGLFIFFPGTPAPAAITQSKYVSHLPQQEPPVGAARFLVQKKLKQKAEARERDLTKPAVLCCNFQFLGGAWGNKER
jgi:hypothetical protein